MKDPFQLNCGLLKQVLGLNFNYPSTTTCPKIWFLVLLQVILIVFADEQMILRVQAFYILKSGALAFTNFRWEFCLGIIHYFL